MQLRISNHTRKYLCRQVQKFLFANAKISEAEVLLKTYRLADDRNATSTPVLSSDVTLQYYIFLFSANKI